MEAFEINFRLRQAGITQTGIARQLGVSASVVGNVVHNRITAFNVAQHIAKAVGMDIQELWPTRYKFKPRGPAVNRRSGAIAIKPHVPTSAATSDESKPTLKEM